MLRTSVSSPSRKNDPAGRGRGVDICPCVCICTYFGLKALVLAVLLGLVLFYFLLRLVPRLLDTRRSVLLEPLVGGMVGVTNGGTGLEHTFSGYGNGGGCQRTRVIESGTGQEVQQSYLSGQSWKHPARPISRCELQPARRRVEFLCLDQIVPPVVSGCLLSSAPTVGGSVSWVRHAAQRRIAGQTYHSGGRGGSLKRRWKAKVAGTRGGRGAGEGSRYRRHARWWFNSSTGAVRQEKLGPATSRARLGNSKAVETGRKFPCDNSTPQASFAELPPPFSSRSSQAKLSSRAPLA